VPEEPTDFAAWVILCQKLDNKAQPLHTRGGTRTTPNPRPATNPAAPPPSNVAVSGTYPGPMDLSAGLARTPKLTLEERDRCITEGRCLRYRRPRHFARECPSKPRSPLRASEAMIASEAPSVYTPASSVYASAPSSPPLVSARPAALVKQLKE